MGLDDLVNVLETTPITVKDGYDVERQVRSIIRAFPDVKYFGKEHPIFIAEMYTKKKKVFISELRDGYSLEYWSRKDSIYLIRPGGAGAYLSYEIDALFEYGQSIVFCEVKSTRNSSKICLQPEFYRQRVEALSSFFSKPITYWAIVSPKTRLAKHCPFRWDGHTLISFNRVKKKKPEMKTPLLTLERDWPTPESYGWGPCGWASYGRHK